MSKFKLPKHFNPGAYPDRPDERDFKYSDVVCGSVQIDWHTGYNVEKTLGHEVKREHQGRSSSCVGQAWAKYAEVLDHVETQRNKDLSAKSIYEQIFLNNGGAYLRDGAKTIVGGGVAEECWIPSYEGECPPSEEYMRKSSITSEMRDKMKTYQAKEYRFIPSSNPDLIAHAIQNNYGAVSGASGDNKGWQDWHVKPPTSSNPWGHAYFYCGFGMNPEGKYFDFINSWGKDWGRNGVGRMYFDEYKMADNTFAVWTLVDKPNTGSEDGKIETIKVKGKPEIFAKSKALNDDKLYWVGGWNSYQRCLKNDWISPYYEVSEIDKSKVVWEPFGFIN